MKTESVELYKVLTAHGGFLCGRHCVRLGLDDLVSSPRDPMRGTNRYCPHFLVE